MVFMPCGSAQTQRDNGFDGIVTVGPARPKVAAKVNVPKKARLTVVDAADIVLAIRPHLRLDQAQTVVNQFQRRCKTGFAGVVAREQVVSLMSSSGFTRDHEYLYKLHDRFYVSRRRAGGLRFREFVSASMVWHHRSKSESMTLQFKVFDLDRDGFISKLDSSKCLQYGMPVRLRDVLREVKEGDKWNEMTFRNKCYERELRYMDSFALGPLGYSYCSTEQAPNMSSDAMSVANISGGSFAMGVAEISAALGQEMTVSLSNQTSRTTRSTQAASDELVPMAVALDIELDSFTMSLPMAQVIN